MDKGSERLHLLGYRASLPKAALKQEDRRDSLKLGNEVPVETRERSDR